MGEYCLNRKFQPTNAMTQEFGGPWTRDKLNILRNYLNAYLKVLKNFSFDTIFIDAFAGSGTIDTGTDAPQTERFSPIDPEAEQFIEGSFRVALQTDSKFSRYVFIDLKKKNAEKLSQIKGDFPELADCIYVEQGDANEALHRLCDVTDWKKSRAVVFLDPYGMHVEWETVKRMTGTKAIDLWYWFPISAVNRLLKKDGQINDANFKRICKIFGSDDWFEEFYREKEYEQLTFGDVLDSPYYKKVNFAGLEKYVINKLKTVFIGVSDNPKIFYNSKNSPLFLFCFAASNEKGAIPALNIADHILTKM